MRATTPRRPVTGKLSGPQQKKLFATECLVFWLDDHRPPFQKRCAFQSVAMAFHQKFGNDDGDCRIEVEGLCHDKPREDVMKEVPIVGVPEIPKQDRTIDTKCGPADQPARVVPPDWRRFQAFVEARTAGDETVVSENERLARCDANIATQMPCRFPARLLGADMDYRRQQLVVHKGIFGFQARRRRQASVIDEGLAFLTGPYPAAPYAISFPETRAAFSPAALSRTSDHGKGSGAQSLHKQSSKWHLPKYGRERN